LRRWGFVEEEDDTEDDYALDKGDITDPDYLHDISEDELEDKQLLADNELQMDELQDDNGSDPYIDTFTDTDILMIQFSITIILWGTP
jgi:hypothetical protein